MIKKDAVIREYKMYEWTMSIAPLKTVWELELLLRDSIWKRRILRTAWRCQKGQMSLLKGALECCSSVVIIKYVINTYL